MHSLANSVTQQLTISNTVDAQDDLYDTGITGNKGRGNSQYVIPHTSCCSTRGSRCVIHDRFGLHAGRRRSRWRPVPSQRVGKTSVLELAPLSRETEQSPEIAFRLSPDKDYSGARCCRNCARSALPRDERRLRVRRLPHASCPSAHSPSSSIESSCSRAINSWSLSLSLSLSTSPSL